MTNQNEDQKNWGDSTWRSDNSEHLTAEESTVNPGDKISEEPKSVEEKGEEVAVESWDIVGKVKVPEYFVAEDQETGEKEALHHVKDAEEISDVIRKARVDEEGDRKWW
jgi:hypothetical protein